MSARKYRSRHLCITVFYVKKSRVNFLCAETERVNIVFFHSTIILFLILLQVVNYPETNINGGLLMKNLKIVLLLATSLFGALQASDNPTEKTKPLSVKVMNQGIIPTQVDPERGNEVTRTAPIDVEIQVEPSGQFADIAKKVQEAANIPDNYEIAIVLNGNRQDPNSRYGYDKLMEYNQVRATLAEKAQPSSSRTKTSSTSFNIDSETEELLEKYTSAYFQNKYKQLYELTKNYYKSQFFVKLRLKTAPTEGELDIEYQSLLIGTMKTAKIDKNFMDNLFSAFIPLAEMQNQCGNGDPLAYTCKSITNDYTLNIKLNLNPLEDRYIAFTPKDFEKEIKDLLLIGHYKGKNGKDIPLTYYGILHGIIKAIDQAKTSINQNSLKTFISNLKYFDKRLDDTIQFLKDRVAKIAEEKYDKENPVKEISVSGDNLRWQRTLKIRINKDTTIGSLKNSIREALGTDVLEKFYTIAIKQNNIDLADTAKITFTDNLTQYNISANKIPLLQRWRSGFTSQLKVWSNWFQKQKNKVLGIFGIAAAGTLGLYIYSQKNKSLPNLPH
jgi:hypothetical protein